MALETEQHGEITIVVTPDDLDARNAPAVASEIKGLLASGTTRLVIDLSPLSFIDSAGLGALLTAYKTARTAGGGVSLCCVSPPVLSILKLTRLEKVFSIYTTREEALAAS